MQYKLINNDQQKTYAVVLESGEEVMEQLMAFAKKEKVSISQFTAIGAFSGAVVGFFDFSIKDYKKIPLREQMEVLTLNGDITLFNDDYKIHAHVILGKEDGRAYGGHLIKATVHPTLEIILNESPAWLCRETDPATRLALIKI
ncbi:MAG TPA: PPC domain-containing DNA-binding protein [Hanamia sp.]|nr:PPC domain-containing DNA-binding protein [Hanamia sp.]